MSKRLSAFILAAGTALAGCSTIDKAAQGAKEDWNRMTASTPAAPASAPANDQRREAPAEVVAAAPSSNVHPRLEAALEKYGSAHVSKGKPDPVSFNTSKCSSELLAGKGPNPVLNRATPGAVQKQAENGAWGAIGGLAGKLPGAAGTAAGRVVQTGRDSQTQQADATQRLCGRLGALNVQFARADAIENPSRREMTFKSLDGQVPGFISQVAAVDSSTRAIIDRGRDQTIEDAARKLLNGVKSPLEFLRR